MTRALLTIFTTCLTLYAANDAHAQAKNYQMFRLDLGGGNRKESKTSLLSARR